MLSSRNSSAFVGTVRSVDAVINWPDAMRRDRREEGRKVTSFDDFEANNREILSREMRGLEICSNALV